MGEVVVWVVDWGGWEVMEEEGVGWEGVKEEG